MIVPLTVDDFLHRAETVFADTVAVVDEPDQPAAPVPTTTYRELARRVRAWQAGLDALGVGPGERVAVVSQNSARLLELLYAVPGERPDRRADQLPAAGGGGALHRRAQRGVGAVRRPRARRGAARRAGAAPDRARRRERRAGDALRRRAARRGPPTRTPPPRSTTPPGPPPGPRASSSPTATSG